MDIAIIGAGISGLFAADRLQHEHRVTLFEANDYLGGHTNTVDVTIDGERHAIDTGFIVFNDRTYPNFVKLLDELGVRSRPTTMGFSVRCERTGLEYNGESLNQLFAQRSNLLRPSFYRLIGEILRFNREAPRQLLEAPADENEQLTVAEFVAREKYSAQFVEQFLLPMGSAVWSCPLGKFAEFPIRFVVEFYQNHGLLDWRARPTWRVVEGGSRTYVEAIVRRFRGKVLKRMPIDWVRRFGDRVELKPRGGQVQSFEQVIFACHADQALRLLADASPTERDLLSEFPYQRNVALLHTDESVLPKRRRAWASWNYLLPKRDCSAASVSYCMNILQHIRSRHTFVVSLNCENRIDPQKIHGQFVYEHPVFNTRRTAAQARHGEVIDVNRTSFCGAYWRNGFHEDGVVSALAVCERLQGGQGIARPAVNSPESVSLSL